jgi:FAD/FMN-containing dehydrogenase/Fe-S oxidoreductase
MRISSNARLNSPIENRAQPVHSAVPAVQNHSMLLPVLGESEQNRAAADLAVKLSPGIRGQLRFGAQDRLLYSTDASMYQVQPLGVIVPADQADAESAIRACIESAAPILPRGGGTSLAGQCTNRAVVIDLSANLRKILSLDLSSRTLDVESGATLDQINRYLAVSNSKLFFAPDPATAAQATLGGCIGNNAAGARSIKYGRTSENLAAVDVMLATGERTTFSERAQDPVVRSLAARVAGVVRRNADFIRQRFPKTIRRNAGYNLDLMLQQLDAGIADEDLDLSGLICGSEGTLAIVLAAKLKLRPLPAARGLALASFQSLEDALATIPAINATGATAVELLDDVVLAAAAGNNDCQKYLSLLPTFNDQLPKAVLYVEYENDLQESFKKLSAALTSQAKVIHYTAAKPIADLWALRKAGEPLLHGIADGQRRPQTFVEDNAIPVERLSEFIQRFKEIIHRHGTTAAYYAHASVGVLHVRPLVDLHENADREKVRAMALEVAELARECGGVMSGEHGDGRVRGPLLERFYGPELTAAFREIKAIFDPKNLLNPGNIVEPGPIESITTNLRIDRERLSSRLKWLDTFFDYSDQHGFEGAVDMCNGAGVCRKTAGGTMCPSYRALLDERHSTRGRGNALRLAITGQMSDSAAPAWNDPETIQTLNLCLSCKACKSECPSNVDIARLKAEYTAQQYRIDGVPLAARVFGHIRRLNQFGTIAPDFANWLMRFSPARAIMNRLLNLAPQRSLPPFARPLRKWFGARHKNIAAKKVVIYEDCFTGFNEPHIGRAAVRVLEAFGYEVVMPRVTCCGRAMISTGLLRSAIDSADAAVSLLRPFVDDPDICAILFLEPSCLSAVKDDWLQLRLKTAPLVRRRLAEKSMMAEDFIERFWRDHPRKPIVKAKNKNVILHGHCHQKALWGENDCAASLSRVSSRLNVLPSGCCGMAGSFGFNADRYELSMKIGELSVFPPLRDAAAETVIAAPGTSCRHQIRDGTGRIALHPIEIWNDAIESAEKL